MGSKFATWTLRSLAVLAVMLLTACTVDWISWHSRGEPLGTVTISHLVIAPLKGNKVEYYPDGAIDQPCTHSLFGHGDYKPCWWVDRHRVTYD